MGDTLVQVGIEEREWSETEKQLQWIFFEHHVERGFGSAKCERRCAYALRLGLLRMRCKKDDARTGCEVLCKIAESKELAL